MGILSLILNWFGGGPLSTIVNALEKAHADALNAKTEEEKIAAKDRIDRLNAVLADTANARASAKGQPWWMAFIAFLIGIGFAGHAAAIAIGTTFQPLIIGGTLDWMLHIPPLPGNYASYETTIVGFFYGYAGAIGVTSLIAGAIRGKGK